MHAVHDLRPAHPPPNARHHPPRIQRIRHGVARMKAALFAVGCMPGVRGRLHRHSPFHRLTNIPLRFRIPVQGAHGENDPRANMTLLGARAAIHAAHVPCDATGTPMPEDRRSTPFASC
jgi:hypothetical protein